MNKFSTAMATAMVVGMTFVSTSAQAANEFEPQIKAAYAKFVAPWLNDPAVISAIKAQNTKHAGMSEGDIDKADKTWRAEKKAGGGDMMKAVLSNALSQFLKGKKDASGGLITEMFVMDNKGMNVGQSDATSDYMQGDEGKWQKSYGAGDGAMFVDEVEFDDSTKSYQAQVSGTISEGGKAIGAITVGMNVENLE
jgi:hypothetical protein